MNRTGLDTTKEAHLIDSVKKADERYDNNKDRRKNLFYHMHRRQSRMRLDEFYFLNNVYENGDERDTEYVFTWIAFLEAVRSAKIDVDIVVEIGVAKGGFFHQVNKLLGEFDLWVGVDPFEVYDNNRQIPYKGEEAEKQYQRALEREKNFKSYQLIRDTSEGASKLFEDNSIGAVYIDGDHRYEYVKQDIELWYPKVKPGGLVSGDDYSDEPVVRAVNEVVGEPAVRGRVWWVIK
jgi:hypothetical protein